MNQQSSLWSRLKRDRFLLLLVAPAMIHYVIFKLGPLWGVSIAFMDFSPYLGYFKSPFVGFKHFARFFNNDSFWILLRNTMGISMMNLVFFFPTPIVLAILMNEVRNQRFKKAVQTLVYLPHFMSWVIIYGITYLLLSQSEGLFNRLIVLLGGKTFGFMMKEWFFWPLLTIQSIWKEAGWGTVIFLASISGIDPNLYEAAGMDGANRPQQIWYITLPAIKSTIIILLILRMGKIVDVSFQQIFLMSNAAVASVSDVFDTYVYRTGLQQGNFSYSSAVGFFKSFVGTVMVLSTNWLSKKFGEEGIY